MPSNFFKKHKQNYDSHRFLGLYVFLDFGVYSNCLIIHLQDIRILRIWICKNLTFQYIQSNPIGMQKLTRTKALMSRLHTAPSRHFTVTLRASLKLKSYPVFLKAEPERRRVNSPTGIKAFVLQMFGNLCDKVPWLNEVIVVNQQHKGNDTLVARVGCFDFAKMTRISDWMHKLKKCNNYVLTIEQLIRIDTSLFVL